MKKWYPDCGDNSCICCPPEQMGGMRTNGGCRCIKHLKTKDRIKMHKTIRYWRDRALAAESVIEIKRQTLKNKEIP